jgi:hypothetical protein
MTLDLTQIYNLLPSVYRVRDAQAALQSDTSLDPSDYATLQELLSINGPLTVLQQQTLNDLQDKQQRGPLKSLISILAEQIEVLQDSLVQSYDDLFIETCADWVVPYIAEIVGLRGLVDVPSAGYTVRAAVADTIKNRRRKGTVPVLESIARDVTDWDANVVEYFQVLTTTQFMNHIRPANLSVSDIRYADHKLLNTPFDAYARTAEMRNIETRLGKYNIPNIGIWLWRLQQQQMEQSPVCKIDGLRYCFDPLAKSIPLFTFPVTENASTPRATPLNVAMPISRWMLSDDLKGSSKYYGAGLSIYLDYQDGPPSGTHICACNLSDIKDSSGNVIGWAHQPQNSIGVDPELGRIVFPSSQPVPTGVQTTYCYGFSSEIGGGPYSRVFDTSADVQVPRDSATIQGALDLAVAMLSPSENSVVVEITDNQYYVETPLLSIPDNCSLQLRAQDGNRPVLVLAGDLVVAAGNEAVFSLNGLLIAGGSISARQSISGSVSDTITLQISHCTINPGLTPSINGASAQLPLPSLWIDSANIAVNIDHSILGPIRIGSENTVSLTTCIVDALSPIEVAYACYLDAMAAGSPLSVTNSTIIGKVHTTQMTLASNSIFLAELAPLDLWSSPVLADQLQQGCVRFSYVPPGSRLPRCFHCYPVAAQVSTPSFTSLRFGDPGYCQLTDRSGLILAGADDQSEVGVFHDVFQPQRLSNLNTMIADYLRFGMEAGVFFAT